MAKYRFIFASFALLAAVSWIFAQAEQTKKPGSAMPERHSSHVTMTPGDIKWGPAPPGLPAGAEMAVLQGDPSKSGVYFHIRAKFPDGYTVPPHWHPTDENVVVIQGAMLLGAGAKFEESATRELPAGSFASMPKGMKHFARAKGESIIDIYGMGPFEITYVNPADDPRKKPSN